MVKTILTFLLVTIGFSGLYAQDIENYESTKPFFSVNVAPNPASAQITLSANSASDFQIKLTDVLGNLILSESFFDGLGKLDISKYRNGIYFITVEAEGVKPITRKLIIRH